MLLFICHLADAFIQSDLLTNEDIIEAIKTQPKEQTTCQCLLQVLVSLTQDTRRKGFLFVGIFFFYEYIEYRKKTP